MQSSPASDRIPVLESEWRPARSGAAACLRLMLRNLGETPLGDFQLGFSSPVAIPKGAEIRGGRMVTQLSTFCEIAPPPGFLLLPGTCWIVDVVHPDDWLRHWSDGAGAGFLIAADGSATPLLTPPARLAGSTAPYRRGTASIGRGAVPPVTLSIVPWPNEVAVSGRRTAPAGLALRGEDELAEQVADDFAALAQFLFPGEGIVRSEAEGGLGVDCEIDRNLPEEAYAITFSLDGASVAGGSERGLLYGLVTLGQMQRGARLEPLAFSFPLDGTIEDRPRMRWRGCHLDVARRFYSGEEIKQLLAILAWNKLNVFHWHLSDDEAWRVEIEAFPTLAGSAAWRGHRLAVPPLLGSGPEPEGGFYTREVIRDIVALGASFGIEIVPEIDMPGHGYAMLQALPQLRDSAERGRYLSVQGFPNNCLNPGVEAVYDALEAILAELLDLFPSAYFHVGADEVPEAAWSGSPACRGLLAAGGAPAASAHLLRRVQAFLTAHGRITGAWEEAAGGGGLDRANCYLVGWQSLAAGRKLAAAGYDVVAAPAQACYLDMAMDQSWDECGASWAGCSSPQATYEFEPAAGWTADEERHLLGVQACIWSEPMGSRAVFDRLVFPRLSAVAEIGWTDSADRDYDRFRTLVDLMPNLYHCREEPVTGHR